MPRLRLRVTAAAESIVRSGHPWLFTDSVRDQNRAGEPGELAVIFDRNDQFLAVGLFDPDSPIRVRILHTGKPRSIDSEWWRAALQKTLDARANFFDAQTTAWRCINGESDGWPGLVLDRYSTTLVLKLYTAAWLPRLEEIVTLINAQIPNERVVLRLSRNIQEIAKAKFKRHEGQVISGAALDGPVIFLESGLRFEADVLRGQKTGFFLDQRENRRLVETFAAGRDVLNAFSFSGAFSLYAARGGARSVTDLDISAHALESSRRNFLLDESIPMVARCRHEFIRADAMEWLERPAKKFDLIILDPPSLAKRESERAGAVRAYEKLSGGGIAALNPGGLLLAASCSAHVTQEEFFDAVRLAARKSGRAFTEIQTTGHAPDHPAKFKEAQYLKAIYLRF
jgi:23S rRNA (cytosine1962-C5)-methyltransferase